MDVLDDLSYDQFIEDKDDIYRVVLDRIYPENVVSYAIIPHSYAHVFVSDIPEVEESTRIVNAGGEFIVTINDKSFKERHASAVDSNFFDFFDIPIIKGDPEKALAVPAAWIFMKKWLLNFAYQTNINIWIFLLSGLIALFVAIFTISVHAFKAASTNPAESLKYE